MAMTCLMTIKIEHVDAHDKIHKSFKDSLNKFCD